MEKNASALTYDYACFMVLAYEFGENKIKDSEKKIKAKLKYNKLGAYDQARVNNLRELTETLSAEINLYDRSRYYSSANKGFCDIEDFDHKKMANDLALKYTTIDKKELEIIVSMAVHLFHCR